MDEPKPHLNSKLENLEAELRFVRIALEEADANHAAWQVIHKQRITRLINLIEKVKNETHQTTNANLADT